VKPRIEERILSCYLSGSETTAFNISELARKTGAAYPHIHAAAKAMIDAGILIARKQGRSSVCRPNLKNGLTRNLLARAAIQKKEHHLTKPNLRNLDAEIERLVMLEPRILAVTLKGERLHFIVADMEARHSTLKRTSLINIDFSTPETLRENLATESFSLGGAIILHGYERLLLIIASEQERIERTGSAGGGSR